MDLELRRATASDTEAVRELALNHRYAEYRCYKFFGYDFASDYLARETEKFLAGEDPNAYLAIVGGQPVGFASAARAEWDSRHFGVEMGSLVHLFTAGSKKHRAAILDTLLEAVEAEARERGLVHLAAKIDIEDIPGMTAVQSRGYRLMDTLVTYINDSDRPRSKFQKKDPGFVGITYHKDQFDQIPFSEVEHIVKFMRDAYRIDRYHTDTRLPSGRSHEVYVEWFKKIFDGSWADGVHVVRKDGKVVAFCSSGQYQHELEKLYGAKISIRGLAGVIPEGSGAYSLITEMGATQCPMGSRLQEYDTQIQNMAVINVWIRHALPFMRGRYTCHRWLDE